MAHANQGGESSVFQVGREGTEIGEHHLGVHSLIRSRRQDLEVSVMATAGARARRHVQVAEHVLHPQVELLGRLPKLLEQ